MAAESNWQSVITVLDVRVAHSIAELLEAEMIAARIDRGLQMTGATSSWTVSVSPEQLDTAWNLLSRSQFTETELTFLATGELGESVDNV